MLPAVKNLPVNVRIAGKGNASRPSALKEMVRAGACALNLHGDRGNTSRTINTRLIVAGEMDVQVMLNLDRFNEAGYVDNTIAALGGGRSTSSVWKARG